MAFMVAAAPVEEVVEGPAAPEPEREPPVVPAGDPLPVMLPLPPEGVGPTTDVMVELPLVPTLTTMVLVWLVPGMPWR